MERLPASPLRATPPGGNPGGLIALALLTLALHTGCAALMASATGRMADQLGAAILDQDDPETVRDGAPAYLLLVDGLIAQSPDSQALLQAGARLYGAYAAAFVDEPERAGTMAARAKEYGRRALCLRRRDLCAAWDGHFETFATAVARSRKADIPAMYAAGTAWAGWIQTHSDDWNAIAQLPRVQALMERVVDLDEGYEQGGAHLYLGVLSTLIPAALGGRPEEGRRHFERAIALSEGRDLMAKVLFARHYARLVFDRELHDRLCREVLDADPRQPGLTLLNTLARREAKVLLAESADYFGEDLFLGDEEDDPIS